MYRYYRNNNGVLEGTNNSMDIVNVMENKGNDLFEQGGRRVELTTLSNGWQVSTVFLTINHAFRGTVPLIFETMVFGEGVSCEYQRRYSTVEDARAGHRHVVAWIESGNKLEECE